MLTRSNKKQESIDQRISIIRTDEGIPNTGEGMKSLNNKKSSPAILFYHHSALITITNTFFAVFMKCFPAFIAFVLDAYSFNYSFVTRSLAIGSFTTMICIIILPPLLHLRSNIVCFLICIIGCIGTFILWYFRHHPILFIIGISLVLNVYQLEWGASNAMISSFVNTNDKHKQLKYLSSLSAAWTFATFLFIAVGYILKYETFWSYLELMFIIFAILSIFNLLILPKVSVNKYNQLHHSKTDLDQYISITHDLKILFNIKQYRLIMFILILGFSAWSYIYTSFGYWIKQIYGLNQAELGIAAALIEGIGNLIAILFITFFAENSGDDEDDHNHHERSIFFFLSKKYKFKLENMMICFAFLLLISIGGIFIINYVVFLQFLMEYREIVYALISAYFCGSEGVIVGALILSVTEVPPSQQARSSALICIANSICLFIGQLTVGIVYKKGGFKLETPILLSIQMIIVISSIYLAHLIKQNRLNAELSWINKHSNPRYT